MLYLLLVRAVLLCAPFLGHRAQVGHNGQVQGLHLVAMLQPQQPAPAGKCTQYNTVGLAVALVTASLCLVPIPLDACLCEWVVNEQHTKTTHKFRLLRLVEFL